MTARTYVVYVQQGDFWRANSTWLLKRNAVKRAEAIKTDGRPVMIQDYGRKQYLPVMLSIESISNPDEVLLGDFPCDYCDTVAPTLASIEAHELTHAQ